MVKRSKLDDMFKPQNSSKKAKMRESRKVESYHSRKVDTEKRGRRQVSFWLPDHLVEAFQIQAVRQKKSKSQLLEEFISKSLHAAVEKTQ